MISHGWFKCDYNVSGRYLINDIFCIKKKSIACVSVHLKIIKRQKYGLKTDLQMPKNLIILYVLDCFDM